MDEQEQNEKIENLETSVEDLNELVNGLIEEQPEETGQEFFEVKYDNKNFIIHWVEEPEGGWEIENYGDAKNAFLAEALDRDENEEKTPVDHGDIMVIGTECPWIALCVVVDSFDQKEDPHTPEVAVSDEITIKEETVVRREFVVWNACGDPNIDPPEPCEREESLDVVAQYVHDFTVTHDETTVTGGTGEPDVKTHTITISKTLKEMVFDNCGRFVEIRNGDDESPTVIKIKECCEEEEPEPSNCPDHNDTYVFTPVGGAPVTLTRLPNTPSGTCHNWYSDTTTPANSDYELIHFGGGSWSIGGSVPPVTCPGAQVNLFGKIGGNANTPLGQYDCMGNPGVSVGEIS